MNNSEDKRTPNDEKTAQERQVKHHSPTNIPSYLFRVSRTNTRKRSPTKPLLVCVCFSCRGL